MGKKQMRTTKRSTCVSTSTASPSSDSRAFGMSASLLTILYPILSYQMHANNRLEQEERLFYEIIDANLLSMLYCLRSKDACVEIIRSFIKSPDNFERLKVDQWLF